MKRFATTLFAVAATVLLADMTAQAQSISIGGYTIRPATPSEVSNAARNYSSHFGSIQSTNPRPRQTARPVYNSAPQARPTARPYHNSAPQARPTSRPSVTMPHSTAGRRPVSSRPYHSSTPQARPVTRPYHNSAPQARPASRPYHNSASQARPTTRPSVTMPHSTAGRRPNTASRRPTSRRPTTTNRDHRTRHVSTPRPRSR